MLIWGDLLVAVGAIARLLPTVVDRRREPASAFGTDGVPEEGTCVRRVSGVG